MFYVSVIDGPKYGLLLGPLGSKVEAEGRVEEVRRRAREVDPFAAFYAFGVSRWKGEPGEAPEGRLNELLAEGAIA